MDATDFSSTGCAQRGIVRRKIHSVVQFPSTDAFEVEVRRREVHMVISGDQSVILSNPEEF